MNSTTSISGTSIRRRLTTTAKQRSQLHNQWKESLRQACVSRARKNRKDLIWKKRQQQQPPATNDDDTMARSLVEQELRQQGVAIVTPGKASTISSVNALNYGLTTENRTNPAQPCSMMADEEEHGFSISEQELDELLQEVEEELRRNEEELLEEILEEERCQQEDMALQIAEYEEWQNTSNNTSMDEEEFVICPLCCEAMLVQQQQQRSSQSHQPSNMMIACPNDTCHFQINSTMGLADLKEELRVAFEEHSMTCPHSGTLTFDLLPPMEAMEQQQLVGSCPECDGVILPVGQMPSASLTF